MILGRTDFTIPCDFSFNYYTMKEKFKNSACLTSGQDSVNDIISKYEKANPKLEFAHLLIKDYCESLGSSLLTKEEMKSVDPDSDSFLKV